MLRMTALTSSHVSEANYGVRGLSSDPGLKAHVFEPCFRGLKPPAPSVVVVCDCGNVSGAEALWMGYFVARLKPCPDTKLSDERAFFRGNEMRRSFAALRMTVLLSPDVSEARHGAPSFILARVGTAGPSNPVAPVAFGWDDRGSFRDDKLSSSHSSKGRLHGAPGCAISMDRPATYQHNPTFRYRSGSVSV